MAMRDLEAVLPLPEQPAECGTVEAWDKVQEQLKTKLPDDWCDFGLRYGSGAIEDAGRLNVWVLDPFSATFQESVSERQCNLEAMKAGEGDKYVPYNVFPICPGLLPLGDDDNGNELYWLTKGEPNGWRIVTRSHESEFEEFDGPLTSFLTKVITRKIAVEIWPKPNCVRLALC
jgi:hypothetical protein